MPELALRELAVGDGVERELHGVVAVLTRELDLHHGTRPRLDHGDRGDSPGLRVEDLGHTQFAAKNAFGHQTNVSAAANWLEKCEAFLIA